MKNVADGGLPLSPLEPVIPVRAVPSTIEEQFGYRPHQATVHRWVLRGARGRMLPTVRIGGRTFVRLRDLQAFLAGSASIGTSLR